MFGKKFIISVFFIAAIIAGTTAYSQDERPPGEHGKKHTPEEMAKHMSERLDKDLDLSDTQQSQVYDIIKDYAASHNRSNFDKSEMDKKISEVLSESQKEKFNELIKNGPPQDGEHKGHPPQGEPPQEKF